MTDHSPLTTDYSQRITRARAINEFRINGKTVTDLDRELGSAETYFVRDVMSALGY